METYQFAILIAAILAATLCFIWAAMSLRGGRHHKKKSGDDLVDAAKEDVERIFNEDFREELRNRGRLYFEKIISENADFLQQDLRLTTSQLHEYMKEELTKVLQQEFAKYEVSINDAKEQAVASIQRTQVAIEQQREQLEQQLKQQVEAEKTQLITKFEQNMGEILNHYIIEAIGSELDLSDQLDYVLKHLEDNKKDIIEDVKSGA